MTVAATESPLRGLASTRCSSTRIKRQNQLPSPDTVETASNRSASDSAAAIPAATAAAVGDIRLGILPVGKYPIPVRREKAFDYRQMTDPSLWRITV